MVGKPKLPFFFSGFVVQSYLSGWYILASFLYCTLISLSVAFDGSWRIPNESFLFLPTLSRLKFQLESLVEDAPGGGDH